MPATVSTEATRTQPPKWLLDLFDDIDSKRFGSAFDVLDEAAEMRFGVIEVKGREAIRERLHEFDGETQTKHHIVEYWDLGLTKAFVGRIEITDLATGTTISPWLCHLWQMSEQDPTKVISVRGAVGPLGNL
jgi:hypothetical protein